MHFFYLIRSLNILVKSWGQALIDKKKTARMPWHDVSIGFVSIVFNWTSQISFIKIIKKKLLILLHIFTGWQTST